MADERQAVVGGLGDQIAGLRRYAFALTGSRHDAEDLVQDTLVRAIAAAGSFRPGAGLRPWLFTIMHNAFIGRVRERRNRAEQGLDEEGGPPEAATEPTQLARLEARDVLAALQRLPEPQRAALVLIAIEGFSYEEAAGVLGIPSGTLMSRLARGRESLRRVMAGEAPAVGPRLRVIGGDRS